MKIREKLVYNGGSLAWAKIWKTEPLSALDVFCDVMISSGLPTPSEQGLK